MPDIADTSDSSYVIVSSGGPESNLPNKRTLAVGSSKVTLTDGGVGSTAAIDTPNAVQTNTSNTMGDFDFILKDNRLVINNPADTQKYIITAAALSGADCTLNLPNETGSNTLIVRNSTDTIDGNKTFKDQRLLLRNPADTFSLTIANPAITAARTLNVPVITGTDTLDTLGLAATFTAAKTFNDSLLKLRNPADTFSYTIVPAAIAANRSLTLPLITATDTLATLGLAQTFTGVQTINDARIGASGEIKLVDTTTSALRTYDTPDLDGRLKVQSHEYFEMEDEFTCGSISNTNTSNQIGVLNWGLTTTGTSVPVVVAGETSHLGIIRLVTGSSTNDVERIHLTDVANKAWCDPVDIERFAWIVRIPTVTSITIIIGIGEDIATASMGTAGAYFTFDSATDSHWVTTTRQASTSTNNTTSITVTAGNWFLLEAVRLSGGNWEFYINNSLVFTHSTNLPTTLCNVGARCRTATTASRSCEIDYFKIRTKKLGQRWT